MHEVAFDLGPGGSIDHWQLSTVRTERYDIADEPMTGDMDAGFFLASQRNYIPHEYPCRRIFAARHRGRKPEPACAFAPAPGAAGWWLPVDGDRVDLSGFWHRPTVVQAWARTTLRLSAGGTMRFRLATCGAAIVRIAGRAVHWMAPYRRNLETEEGFAAELPAGNHSVEVWFTELCERDTRWWFRLGLHDDPAATVVLPFPVLAETARHMLSLLAGMHFDRPSYDGGPVGIAFDRPADRPIAIQVAVAPANLEGGGPIFAATLDAGARRVALAPAAAWPADFLHCTVTLTVDHFSLAHGLAVEVSDATGIGLPPPALSARVAEALGHARATASADPSAAVARLADGDGEAGADAETERILADALPPIEDCWDCADFHLVPLLWARMRHGDTLTPALVGRIEAAILGFRYWLDEPGNDVMWFFSENHALLFHASAYLAGTLFPDATFIRSGRAGAEQRAVGAERLHGWFDHFEACELAEWNAAPYIPIDLKGLCALYVLAPDTAIRDRAERAILRLLEIVALSCHQGMIAASQGRSYEHSLRSARTLELSAIARMLWGRGWHGRQAHALPLLALAIRDHGLAPPPALQRIACWQDDRALEWLYAQGEGGLARLSHWKTRHWAMGSVAAFRPFRWGYQETVLHARIGDHPDTQIWINHPGERIVSGFGRPSYWGGCATVPRVHQHKGLALLRFAGHPETPDFTHAHVAEAAYDEFLLDGNRLLLRSGAGLALLQASGPLEQVAHGATAGIEIRLAGHNGDWLVRLSDLASEGSLQRFADRMAALAVEDSADGTIRIADPDYGMVACGPAGVVRAEGRALDPSTWTLAGEARLSDGTPLQLPSQARTAGGAR